MNRDDSNDQNTTHIIPTKVIGIAVIGAGLILSGLGALLASGGFASGAHTEPDEKGEEQAPKKRKRWLKRQITHPYAMFPDTESALDSYTVVKV
jgi:hypothetical protein